MLAISYFIMALLLPFATSFKMTANKVLRTSILRMSTMPNVKSMTPAQFQQILKSDIRSQYQIIDVREPNELAVAKLAGDDVMNLPLGSANEWSTKVQNGELLDASKPTICMCHHGGRSMRVASFLVGTAKFGEVYNMEGGIHQYAVQVDPSIPTY